MKIKDIRVHIINAPIDTPFKYSQRWVYDRSSVLVEVPMGPGIGVEVNRAVIEKYEIAL